MANPRKLASIEGIEVLSGLTELLIEGARQLQDYAPLASLSGLRSLSIIDSAAPASLAFLDQLRVLEKAMINGREYLPG